MTMNHIERLDVILIRAGRTSGRVPMREQGMAAWLFGVIDQDDIPQEGKS
jgi:hypothetical protein